MIPLTNNATRDSRAAFDGIRRAWPLPASTVPIGPAVPQTRSIDGIARTSHNAFASPVQQSITPRKARHLRSLSGVDVILGSLDGIRMPQLAR